MWTLYYRRVILTPRNTKISMEKKSVQDFGENCWCTWALILQRTKGCSCWTLLSLGDRWWKMEQVRNSKVRNYPIYTRIYCFCLSRHHKGEAYYNSSSNSSWQSKSRKYNLKQRDFCKLRLLIVALKVGLKLDVFFWKYVRILVTKLVYFTTQHHNSRPVLIHKIIYCQSCW